MYKTREDVEEMILLIESIKENLRKFGYWVLESLSSPTPGVVCSEPLDDVDSEL
tara:strand:- start:5109 stop:5270 length:162 start_codon:yes stop_codon:yes gene_type:complete